jgi:15-cis-phytoene synthase
MSALADLVKAHDYDRYIATLFAPAEKRDALFSLYAFDAEVSRIADLVHDPMPGEIRLQWWRDVANGERDGEAAGHPIASALLKIIAEHALPRSAFDSYCEARIFDFYNDVMPDEKALEAYLGATQSAIIQLAAIIVDPQAARGASEAAGHAGVAKGIAMILSQMPRIRRKRQGFVPLTILNASGLSQDAFLAGPSATVDDRLTGAIAALGQEHLKKFRVASNSMATSLRPAFASLASAHRQLEGIEKLSDPLGGTRELSYLLRLWDVSRFSFKRFRT